MMANKCTVTKFNGVVDNSNLPVYGVTKVSLFRGSRNANPCGQFAASEGAIHLTSKIPFSIYGQSGTFTECSITYPTTKFLTFQMDQVQDADLIDAVTIDNFYKCSLFYISGNWTTSSSPQYRCSMCRVASVKQNLQSMYKYAPVEIASVAKDDIKNGIDINDACYYLLINSDGFTTTPKLDVSKYMNMPNMEVIAGCVEADGVVNYSFPATISGADNYNNSNVIILGCCFDGPITNLPLGIKFVVGTGLNGVVEDFVTYMRSHGRTEGNLVITSANYASATFGGTAISTLLANNEIPSIFTNVVCLSWDSSHPTGYFLNTIPGDAVTQVPLPSIYYSGKH